MITFVPSAKAQDNGIYKTETAAGFFDLFGLTPEEQASQSFSLEGEPKVKLSADKLSERYVRNCLNQSGKKLINDKIREYLCLCSAARMTVDMDSDDIRGMFDLDPKKARLNQERLLVLGVMPCLEKPAHFLAKQRCMEDKVMELDTNDHAGVCQCIADEMIGVIEEQGSSSVILRNVPLEDLLYQITDGMMYRGRYRQTAISCKTADKFGYLKTENEKQASPPNAAAEGAATAGSQHPPEATKPVTPEGAEGSAAENAEDILQRYMN